MGGEGVGSYHYTSVRCNILTEFPPNMRKSKHLPHSCMSQPKDMPHLCKPLMCSGKMVAYQNVIMTNQGFVTRKHCSRMHTASFPSSGRGKGICPTSPPPPTQTPPWMQTPHPQMQTPSSWMKTPLDVDPHWMQTPPTGCRPLPPGCRPFLPSCNCDACWEAKPTWTE